MDKARAREIAQICLDAKKNAKVIPEELRPVITTDEAHEVLDVYTEMRVAAGERIIGKKVGFTSEGMRKLFNVKAPDFGILFDGDMHFNGDVLDASKFISPMIEVEIAFKFKKDLDFPNVSPLDVMEATEGVLGCLEIVDSRWQAMGLGYLAICDNGSCGGYVIGSKMVPLTGLDLRKSGMYLQKNGKLMNSGLGIEVMGDPVVATAWTASRLFEHGQSIKAGDLFMSGAICAAMPIAAGDNIHVEYTDFGSIDLQFR